MEVHTMKPPNFGVQIPIVTFLVAVFWMAISYVLYNLFLHPLSKFPGPTRAAASPIWILRVWLSGRYVHYIKALHDEYGPVVRTSPNQLSFNSATSWKDIYGHNPGRKQFLKGTFYEPLPGEVPNIVSVSDPVAHAAMRKTLSHGFSASALAAQEDLIHEYVDLFVRQIEAHDGDIENLNQWLNFITFDIIGELAFGESFGSLDAGRSHYWIDTFFGGVKARSFVRAFEYLPLLRSSFRYLYKQKLLPGRITSPGRKSSEYARQKLEKRLQNEPRRTDFLTKVIAERKKNGTSFREMQSQASLLVFAGSETTATTMAGITYHLGRYPQVYEKLVHEIREGFSSYADINGRSTERLRYLAAVIEEGLRTYPPIAVGLPRVSPRETVDGQFVPKGTIVNVSGWAATHSETNFHQAFEFIPERWLDPECTDKKAASQPFLLGSRVCLGRNLAQLELRVLLAKILWTFDFTLKDDSVDLIADSKSMISTGVSIAVSVSLDEEQIISDLKFNAKEECLDVVIAVRLSTESPKKPN